MANADDIVSISDPGEVGRQEHNVADRTVVGLSNWVAWIYPLLMFAIVAQVFLRGAGHNQAWLDDLQWWLYGVAVLIGVAYAVTTTSHVRVDIFFDNFKPDRQTRVEIFGLTWLFLPFILISWDVTFHYTLQSWATGEGSDSPNGLHRLYLLKTAMNLSFLVIAVAIWAAYIRNLYRLTHPAIWKQLLFALPSTLLIVNLVCFYILFWSYRLTTDLQPRAITREPVFDVLTITTPDGKSEELLILGSEVSILFVITVIVTALLIGIAYAARQRPSEV